MVAWCYCANSDREVNECTDQPERANSVHGSRGLRLQETLGTVTPSTCITMFKAVHFRAWVCCTISKRDHPVDGLGLF